MADVKLTAAREATLRSVAKGWVYRDNHDALRPCWDANRRRQVKAQVDWLRNAGLVTVDVTARGYAIPVTVTPAGQEWLGANPEKEN